MTNRTTDAYVAALKYVNDHLLEINGSGIIIDFEKAMRAAVKKVAPNIPILGCWFHFCQALRRQMASMKNLLALTKENFDAKLIFRKFQCLALLPYDKIKDGFVYLLREALNENEFKEFAPFIDYFKKEWMQIVTPEYFSVWDTNVRTTGTAEAFNRKLNNKFRTHPSFYNFVESLQREELCKTDEFYRHVNGKIQPDTRKNFYVHRNEMIIKYSEKLKNGELNYKHFLNVMSNNNNKIFFDEDQILDDEDVRDTESEVSDSETENVRTTFNNSLHDCKLNCSLTFFIYFLFHVLG